MSIYFFGKIILQQGVNPDQSKIHMPTDVPPLKTEKELQSFLGKVNYLSKFSPVTLVICE